MNNTLYHVKIIISQSKIIDHSVGSVIIKSSKL